MELAQINQRIAVVNAESKRLNNERAVNIGKRETLEKQLNESINLYNQTYGANLSIENLNAEIEKVSAEKEQEVSNIETVIDLIKSGKFDEAQSLVTGIASNTTVVNNPVSNAQSNVAQVQNPVPTQPIPQPTLDTPVSAPVLTPPISAPVEQAQVAETPVVSPITPPITGAYKQQSLSGLDINVNEQKQLVPNLESPTPVSVPNGLSGLDDVPTPPAPPTAPNLGTPPVLGKPPVLNTPNLGGNTASEAPVTSFNAILGGSPFKPQGNV